MTLKLKTFCQDIKVMKLLSLDGGYNTQNFPKPPLHLRNLLVTYFHKLAVFVTLFRNLVPKKLVAKFHLILANSNRGCYSDKTFTKKSFQKFYFLLSTKLKLFTFSLSRLCSKHVFKVLAF